METVLGQQGASYYSYSFWIAKSFMRASDQIVLPTFKYRLPPETTWTLFAGGANASDHGGGYFKSVDWTAGNPNYELSVFGGSSGFLYAMWKEPSVVPTCSNVSPRPPSPFTPCSTICNLNSLTLYGIYILGYSVVRVMYSMIVQ